MPFDSKIALSARKKGRVYGLVFKARFRVEGVRFKV